MGERERKFDEPTLNEFIDDRDVLVDVLGEVDDVRPARAAVDAGADSPEDDEPPEVIDDAIPIDHVTRPEEELAMEVEPEPDVD